VLAGYFRWRTRGAAGGGAVARELLGLPLVRRAWIVNAAQNATIHQMPRGLFHFAVTFFTASHTVRIV
jgi:hypothetical protein